MFSKILDNSCVLRESGDVMLAYRVQVWRPAEGFCTQLNADVNITSIIFRLCQEEIWRESCFIQLANFECKRFKSKEKHVRLKSQLD